MSTTTTIKVEVSLFEKSMVYLVNMLLRLGLRIEAGRVEKGSYIAKYLDMLERGLRIWVTEGKLLAIHYELYSPGADKAYERCVVELSYSDDPAEAVAKPLPVDAFEALFQKLAKLPPDASLRVLVGLAPGYTEVPGWGDDGSLKDLWGGMKAEHTIGSRFGYGPIEGEARYFESNWQQGRPDA
jgi:hypothetical protein